MQTAIAALQTRLRSLFRPYFRDGDPASGLNEPDLESIRFAFGTELIAILARQLVGPAGAEYPELPTPEALNGKLLALNLSGPTATWTLIDAARVEQAADLVDFEGTIDSEIAAAVAGIIAGISDDAPFSERFPDEATLLADLDFPADAYAIDMETLVIYRKTGATGAGSWVVHSNILDAFPGTASAEDVAALNERADDADAEIVAIKKRLDRLDTAVPPIPPVWRLVPPVIVDETFTGTVRDLADYVDDADTPAENLVFTAPGGLPAGFSISGRNLVKTSTSGIVARSSFALAVTDESGNAATNGAVLIEAYPEGEPPGLPPSWLTLPPLSSTLGSQGVLFFSAYLNDPDTDLADIECYLASPVSGIEVVSAEKRINFLATLTVGVHTFTLVAEDPEGNTASVTHSVTVLAAGAPVIAALPARFGQVFASPITMDLNAYVTDANTPLSELGTSLAFSNAPEGTTKGGTNNLVLTIPVSAATQRSVSVTVTNRAGLTATRSFDLTILPFNPGSGGGVPGGYGDGRQPY
ncbi:MAG: hypothetical protein IPK75_12835 [Acidobacteria bacterium]|nr:hypothetical protein [Acidobacteriota bacterium]